MKQILIALTTIFFFCQTAFAGFMIEPYVGYEKGTLEQTNTADIDHNGMYYGARLGYDFVGLKFGLDYQSGNEDAEQSGNKGEYKLTDMGAFVGYTFPILLQIYASYFFDSKATIDSTAVTNPEEFTGTGTRIGIGWTGLPFLSINIEMITRSYDKYGSQDISANQLETSATALSISLPLP